MTTTKRGRLPVASAAAVATGLASPVVVGAEVSAALLLLMME
ncbi:MAG: hypothetical protein ACKOUR_10460 [Planctomycetota bacterium]